MRRVLVTSVLSVLLAAAFVVAPVSAEPKKHPPHPVSPTVRTLQDRAADATFTTIGATWDPGATGQVQVRAHGARGWTPWTELEATDAAPDAGTRDARGAGTVTAAPLWVGPSDRYETRVAGDVPGLRVVVVDPGTSDADDLDAGIGKASAAAAAAEPTVHLRAEWGADESLRSYNGSSCASPSYTPTIKVGFVHHTDGANDYTSAQVPAVLRGIYAYHVKTNGWCDLGYNLLVDRFGRVWEGRYGGAAKPVLGSHTGGHNANSFGVALLGTYSTTVPSAAMLDGLANVLAWKLSLHYADPRGTAQLTSAGGGTSKYAAGTTNAFNVISGHRDAGSTACPGDATYARLATVRDAVVAKMGAGLVLPAVSSRTAAYAGGPLTVTSKVLQAQTWRLDLSRAADGAVVRSFTGSASPTAAISQSVDLKDSSGAWLPPGGYTLTLTSASGAQTAVPWSAPLTINAPPGSSAPGMGFVPVTPTRVLSTRTGVGSELGRQPVPADTSVSVRVLGVGSVPASGVGAVALNLTGIAGGGATYLTAYQSGSPVPRYAALNLGSGETRGALVMPQVGSDGRVSVYNRAGTTDVVVDVVGYFPTSGGSTYTPLTPARLVSTRTTKTPLRAGETRSVQVAGAAGVPQGATSVVASITVLGPTSAGWVTVYPSGVSRPGTSTVNFGTGGATTNRFVSGLSQDGKITLYAGTAQADVVIDVVGYFSATGSSSYTGLPAARVLDTRAANGVPGKVPVSDGSTTCVVVAGRGGVPSDAKAALVALTATGATRAGYVTAWDGQGRRPGVNDLSTVPGSAVANLVVVRLGGGSLCLYNAGGPVHLVGEAVGYFR